MNGVDLVLPTGGLARPVVGPRKENETVGKGDNSFPAMMERYMRELDQTLKESQESTLRLLAGEDIDIHSVVIAQERAALELSLAIQVRNKVIEAYQEIMRMQV